MRSWPPGLPRSSRRFCEMKHFFNPENGFWQIFGVIGDLLILSMLWTVCSVPLVTTGAASCALYDAVAAGFRRHEQEYLQRFFQTFRRELKSSLLPTLLCGAVLAAAFCCFRALAGRSLLLAAIGLALLLLPLGTVCWVFPLLSRFTLGFRALLGNALRLALGHAPSSCALAAGLVLVLWLTLRLALLPLFLLPALFALYCTLFLEPVFHQYETAGR